MNSKIFYGLLVMIFAGSVSLTEMESTKLADVVTVGASDNFDEFKKPRKKELEVEIELDDTWELIFFDYRG
ncbi:hypothetical protein A9Q86_08560 [Flavobacteriales bacterium 33_180_T64]|nr:hypothetical protein A9Q86_08560 [Flavobacteriales bacterium 33_180_T64]